MQTPRILFEGCYGEIYATNASTAQSIPTGSTYTKVTAFTTAGSNKNCNSDSANDQIVITNAGAYKIDASFASQMGTANVVLTTKLFLNNNPIEKSYCKRKFGNASDISTGAFTGILQLAVGDVLDIRVIHDNPSSVNLTIEAINLNCNLVGH